MPMASSPSASTRIAARPLEELEKLQGTAARVLRGYDAKAQGLFESAEDKDKELATWLSEERLVKDAWEVQQLQEAVDSTIKGFEDVVRALPQAQATSERWAEGVFGLRASGRSTTWSTGPRRLLSPSADLVRRSWTPTTPR